MRMQRSVRKRCTLPDCFFQPYKSTLYTDEPHFPLAPAPILSFLSRITHHSLLFTALPFGSCPNPFFLITHYPSLITVHCSTFRLLPQSFLSYHALPITHYCSLLYLSAPAPILSFLSHITHHSLLFTAPPFGSCPFLTPPSISRSYLPPIHFWAQSEAPADTPQAPDR